MSSCKFKWSRSLLEKLINEYQSHPNLYDMGHPDYIHRQKRERSYNEIYMALKKINNGISLAYIRMKIKTLRTQYVKELRRIEISENDPEAEEYKTNFWCYDQLHFLEKHCTTRRAPGSRMNKSEKQSYQYINDSLENESSEPPVKIKKLEKNSFQDFYESHNHNLFENESPETVPKPKQLKAEYLEDHDEDHDGNHDENDDSCETVEASDLKSQRKRYALEKIRQQIKETTKLFQVELEEKYDWLGKQVVFEINKIQNEELQEHTAWDIQQILRESIQRDRQLRETEETSSTTQPSSSEVCSWMINAKDRDPLDK